MSRPVNARLAADPRSWVDVDALPIAALLTHEGRIVGANPAYEALMGVRAADLIGCGYAETIQRFVVTPDVPVIDEEISTHATTEDREGHLWCRVRDGAGRLRTLKVIWQRAVPGRCGVVYLLDAEHDAAARAHAEALARAGGELVRSGTESEVLIRAVGALAARGFTATVLLLREGDPHLAYGPTRKAHEPDREPSGMTDASIQAARPERAVLERFNPGFHDRRAAFFQNGVHLVEDAYPERVSKTLKKALPGRRMVQAPLFVDDQAYGALVVTSDALTPALAGTIEMFAGLVSRAIESVRANGRAVARLEELEQLQSELVERERLAALGEAAAVMAHEVRNPVAAILNAVAVLRRAGTQPEPGAEMYRVIDEEATRLGQLVSNLLDLGRPLLPRLFPVDLRTLAAKSIEVLAKRGGTVGCNVQVDGEAVPCMALADADLVQLALLNVLANAVQASPDGEVAVRVERHEEWCTLIVDDNGPGFSEEIASRMFEPFFTTRALGTGIGLAVVRRVVEANRGVIEIGRSPAGGGRLVLRFPPASG